MTGWEKPWRSSNVTEEWWWTAKVVQTPGASAEEKKSVEHKSYHWTAFLIPTHRALRVVPIPPDPNDRFPVPVPQLGWSWIGIGSSDCEPAGGCRLAQSECRFNGAQRRVSQPVGPFRVWAALCICALFHSLAQTEARGPPWGGVGERTAHPRSRDDQWQTSTENRKDIIPEHETDLSAREGFPPPHLLQNREC